ncbi:transcription-repair coupling factor [Haemophilus influenzae]|uniref:Transcription-repair-coupling factor n=2 Tax=Gammaproteobacteria TaxID=1236 RepID=MFD_HAEIN|nr:transcription-repair coupling factor [Haemophilus influenzae]P45128.1 RecName: Full=Transcription-repair-coupling factor; Short=TRCF [Haemophilus influenzae Rd KW20]AAC22905.1 transcription-repair coupling factor (mfd) [Haemophilus influenzae Rd KW20]ARB89683.1 transcription-repair coupling factor [Haemophilus influenzae]EEW76145.1 transcription-repair coupling factor [Haemophilus influenzae RdAW]MCK9046230.1 transcription-repair coupling factor [Haemophilus influenzae]
MKTAFFQPDIPTQPNDHKILGNVLPGADALAISEISEQNQNLTVVVTPDTRSAVRLSRVLSELSSQDVCLFPDWETLPYDTFSPHQEIISSRLSALFHLQNAKKGIFLLPISTLMQRLCPPQYLQHNVLLIKKGDRLVIDKMRLQLEAAGYRAVEQVLEHGEYAVRGALLDLFPMGSAVPFRLDFFDDEIDSIRTFDVDTQRTLDEISSINLLPAHEFPTDDKGIEFFRAQFRETFGEIRRDPEHIYQQISKGTLISGIEYWQPLFFAEMATLFDYLPEQTLFVDMENNQTQGERFYQDAKQRYEQRKVDPMRPLLSPEKLWLNVDEVNRRLKSYPRITFKAEKVRSSVRQKNLPVAALPEVTIQSQQKEPLGQLRQFIEHFKGNVLFSVETEGRRETLLDLLSPLKLKPKQIQSLEQIENEKFSLLVSSLEQGFIIEQSLPVAIIGEANLLGKRIQQRSRDKRKTINPDTLVRNLAELKIGQPVVHLDHGVGRYGGLVTLDTGGIKAEYLLLNYANESKLYVPVTSLHLISRYVGGSDESAPLHKLGNEAWAKSRQKAAEKIRDVAAELLDVYAQREAKKGFAFKYDREEFQQFSATFPFEETYDQEMAINAVISDMCQPKAMDRLVCGDVGFGKTEVAMRAAFLAVMNHKQVAVLVPTTLLAQQHYENFKDRFANLPVNVEVLSRFKTAKEQKQILENLAEGKVDILIGTHKLIQSDVKFNDLGLLIIDEEHRFGVGQKEKIKQLRANIDILTLTATPIPRTLNMAMNGIRDLSIISTPPARRLSIKTFVRQNDDLVVREAILREILRGGQVYYLHNDVASIENTAEKLTALVPEARVIVGHGQMRERELERVMSDFYHQRYNVLVCSTIIETGIDVPTANTIIIERADHFGLAQLHQLRGRVGRSHHQAYAYLLTPPPKMMTKDAERRLDALENLDNLGAGFILATHDLEIRGAGELLGNEQSGQIESIGFSLYMELLDAAVKALKEGREPSLEELTQQQADIELRVPALLPDDYLGDVNMRLSFYKRIAAAESKAELDELKVELIDRFGLLPDATKNLLQITELRLLVEPLNVVRIDAGTQGGFIEFSAKAQVNPDKFIQLIQKEPIVYRFDGPFKFKFMKDLSDNKVRLEFVVDLLRTIAA